jgi:transmembrane sensor
MSDQGLQSPQIDREAAAWFARLKSRDVSNTTLRDFWAWRGAEAHAAAYEKVEAAWAATGALTADPEIAAATRAAQAQPPLRTAKVTWSPIAPPRLGLLATGIGLSLLALTGVAVTQPPAYSTRVGQQRTVLLSDGSRVRLNTNSKIRVRFRRAERDIELVRGEAFFDAAHDATRPFVVQAADANVRALGTRFDVRRDTDGVWVALVEGKVNVTQDRRTEAAVLTPNEQLRVSATGISPPHATNAADATSWTAGRLVFHDVTLRDAVAQVNRYAARKIELDPALGAAPLSGSFNTGDTEAFVLAVKAMFGLRTVSGDGDAIRLAPDPARPPA